MNHSPLINYNLFIKNVKVKFAESWEGHVFMFVSYSQEMDKSFHKERKWNEEKFNNTRHLRDEYLSVSKSRMISLPVK
jgi:hypothetical protein